MSGRFPWPTTRGCRTERSAGPAAPARPSHAGCREQRTGCRSITAHLSMLGSKDLTEPSPTAAMCPQLRVLLPTHGLRLLQDGSQGSEQQLGEGFPPNPPSFSLQPSSPSCPHQAALLLTSCPQALGGITASGAGLPQQALRRAVGCNRGTALHSQPSASAAFNRTQRETLTPAAFLQHSLNTTEVSLMLCYAFSTAAENDFNVTHSPQVRYGLN